MDAMDTTTDTTDSKDSKDPKVSIDAQSSKHSANGQDNPDSTPSSQSVPSKQSSSSSQRSLPESRNKRIFGHLMKSLGTFQQESLSVQRTERETKRREIEARIEERQRAVDEEVHASGSANEYHFRGSSDRSRAQAQTGSRNRSSSRNARDMDWRRRRSQSPPMMPRDSAGNGGGGYRDRDRPRRGFSGDAGDSTVIEISSRDRRAPASQELLRKFEAFRQQASFLRTRSFPPILYLPSVLSEKEQTTIDDQLDDADRLLENCSNELSV